MSTQASCPCGGSDKCIRHGLCRKCREAAPNLLASDRDKLRTASEVSALRLKYAEALRTIEGLEQDRNTLGVLKQSLEPFAIQPKFGQGTSEATVNLIASDWHIEERVDSATVNGLNEYDLDIAKARGTQFFRAGMRLVKLLKQDVKIPTIVLGLLGDFITGQIHGAENAESNLLLPTDAIVFAQNLLVSGVEFMLEEHDGDIVIVCASGNHARTTVKTRLGGTENGHSYEYLMYLHLATYFKSQKRVRFIISESYHTYLPVYDKVIRYHHGHRLKYGGGRGGLFTPTYTGIDDWNKAKRADLDVFGHFHQMRDGGNFLCNGSLIGYNGFAQAIKAAYEPPRQTLFLMDKKRGRTCTWPILFY